MKLSKIKAASATRNIGGADIPRINTTSAAMRAAMKKGGSRYAGEGDDVGGSPAKSRLDRPDRKSGGRVCKADGGEATEKDKKIGLPDPISSGIETAKSLGRIGRGVKGLFMKDGSEKEKLIEDLAKEREAAKDRTKTWGWKKGGRIKKKPDNDGDED